MYEYNVHTIIQKPHEKAHGKCRY